MKPRFLVLFFLIGVLLLPAAAGATQCCDTPPSATSGPYGQIIAPETCFVKTGNCSAGDKQIDCGSSEICKKQVPMCCVFTSTDPNKKSRCYETSDKNFSCASLNTDNMTQDIKFSLCTDVAECPKSMTETPPAASATGNADAAPPAYPVIVPKIPLDIPTVSVPDFAKVTQQDGYLYIPFISVFLVGAYKIGVGLAAVLAVIFIMIGGFIWIAAAGDSGRIGQGKKMISSAVVGLILTIGSYVTLQTVNPDLISFKALKIPVVSTSSVDVIDDYNYETATSDDAPMNSANPSQYDAIFKKYAPCAGVTPDALKAIAQAESGLNPNAGHGQFVGFFQIGKKYCPSSMTAQCNNLTDPDNNTAVGAAMIKASVNKIKQKCPVNTSAHDQMIMIYIGHNNGPAALNLAIKNGCDTGTMKQTLTDYYASNPSGQATAAQYSSEKTAQKCLNGRTDTQSLAECTAGPKFDFAQRLASKSDATIAQVISTSSSGTCPY